MFNPSNLLKMILPCCATGSSDPGAMKALLDKNNIGILSAACCDSTAGAKDEGLKKSLREAMEKSGDNRAVIVDTITSASSSCAALKHKPTPARSS